MYLSSHNIAASNTNFDIGGDITARGITISSGDASVIDIDTASTVTLTNSISIASGPNTIDVYGTINADNGTFSGGTNTLNIYSGGIVNITNGVSIIGSAGLNVGNSGDLNVFGDVTLTGGSSLSVTGSMDVAGNMTMSNGIGTVEVDGTLTVDQTLDIGANNISGSGLISANPLKCAAYIGDCSSIVEPQILPVELVFFNATAVKNGIELSWQTAYEENNDYFTIERSVDGINFEEVKKTVGAGNSTTLISYSEIDYNPIIGTSYYRLKQTDYNGDFSYSDLTSVYFNSNPFEENGMKVYPSPYKGGELILENLNIETDSPICIKIISINGQILYKQHDIIPSNNKLAFVPTNKLTKGLYIITLQTGNKLLKSKLIVE